MISSENDQDLIVLRMYRSWDPNYLRTAQVADLLYVSPKTVPRWAKEGKLPFLKTLGGHRRYPEAEIRELAEELREEAMT